MRVSDNDKVLTYKEAKELCEKAFDGGSIYGSESMRYGCNAAAYDWNHWLKENENLFKPKPTVEDVLREFALEIDGAADVDFSGAVTIAKYAKLLRLAGDAE